MSRCEVIENDRQCSREGVEFAGGGETIHICDKHLKPRELPAYPCYACGAPMTPFMGWCGLQCEDALGVILVGGYGMFVDTFEGDPRIDICSNCATEACEKLPWLAKALEPWR